MRMVITNAGSIKFSVVTRKCIIILIMCDACVCDFGYNKPSTISRRSHYGVPLSSGTGPYYIRTTPSISFNTIANFATKLAMAFIVTK